MKQIIGVQFNNREDAERMFMEQHPNMKLGRAGRIAWLIIMLVFYTVAGIPYLMLDFILTIYSQVVTLVLFATNPTDMDLSNSNREEPS